MWRINIYHEAFNKQCDAGNLDSEPASFADVDRPRLTDSRCH